MEIDVDVSPKRRRDDEPPEKIALLFWEGVINLSGGVHKLKSEGANGEHTTIPSTAVTTAAVVNIVFFFFLGKTKNIYQTGF
jgi:hypothetical protein